MLFNSWAFAAFFATTYGIYVFLRPRPQNVLLLVASYVFYGFWDWRFLGLIVFSTVVDYCCALAMAPLDNGRRRRQILGISICVNLGLLGIFKYFNFFAESLQALASQFGWHLDAVTLRIVLPVGISFYTFQTMSYTIDVYRGHIAPTRNFLNFALFVAFFPQLVAGPIERASALLPQIERRGPLTEAKFHEGLWLVFLGLFKKVFIADNLAPIVERAFGEGADPTGAHVVVAVYAFAFQIYGDFSGYSDIARGIAQLMGFNLTVNFRMPYFARDIREFWRRWHITLSSWLRDYVYVTLGGNRLGRWASYRNLLVTMVLGGLWHGAAWTFVVWGFYHGLLLVAHRALPPLAVPEGRMGLLWSVASMALTFHAVCLGWLFFRSDSLGQAVDLLRAIAVHFGEPAAVFPSVAHIAFLVTVLLGIQVLKETTGDLNAVMRLPVLVRGPLYLTMAVLMLTAGAPSGREFIYFQF